MKVERVSQDSSFVLGDWTITLALHELQQLHLVLLNSEKMPGLAMRIEEALRKPTK
jgi:hypothetical protein